jgi:hypothetical protein
MVRLLFVVLTVSCMAVQSGESAPAPIKGGVKAEAFEEKKAAPDKSMYHLFKPTPKDQMRELSTDRPDKTESPYTLDAGHFQFESDVFSFTRDSETHTKGYSIMATNFKVGLTNRVDLQLVFEPYNYSKSHERDEDGVRFRETAEGFGDTTVRLKYNFWGNDGGKTAFGIMPFVKFPTNQNDQSNNRVEGGVILPFAAELPWGVGLGAMTEVDFVYNDDDGNYDTAFVNTITFTHDVVGSLGAYVEFFSEVNTDGSPWIGTVDGGFTWGITDDIQLDFGVNVGVTRSADDINPFLGLTMRF